MNNVKKPELNACLVAKNIANQLEKRVSFRRAMKMSSTYAIKQGAKGIKVSLSGRIEGSEIARVEWSKFGNIPLNKFSENIDYFCCPAKTIYGIIGVKVWINKGEYNEFAA